jgi:hypothetical protein
VLRDIYHVSSFNDLNATFLRSRVSSVVIATAHGLDGPGSIPGSKIFHFPTASRPTLGSSQPPIQWVPGAISPK